MHQQLLYFSTKFLTPNDVININSQRHLPWAPRSCPTLSGSQVCSILTGNWPRLSWSFRWRCAEVGYSKWDWNQLSFHSVGVSLNVTLPSWLTGSLYNARFIPAQEGHRDWWWYLTIISLSYLTYGGTFALNWIELAGLYSVWEV